MIMNYRGTGKVIYKDKEYKCSLYANEEEGGAMCRMQINDVFSNMLTLPFDIKYLGGELDNGSKFTLYNLKRTKYTSFPGSDLDVFEYQPKYVLNGIVCESEPPCFNRVEYTLNDIILWGGITTFEIDKHFKLSKKSPSVQQEILYSNHNFCISYSVVGDLMPMSEFELTKSEIKLIQKGVIIIQSKTGECEIDYFDDKFERVKQLIELSTLKTVSIESISAFSENYVTTLGDNHSFQKQIRVTGADIKNIKNNNEKSIKELYWISLNELVANNSFELFFKINDKLQPIVDLYLEPITYYGSARRTFLNVVQSLETYHSRFITNNLKEYKERVDSLLEKYQGDKEVLKEFLFKHKKKISLQNRLADLLYAENQIHFFTGDIKFLSFPKAISDTRNYYIHYDKSKKERILTEEELKIYYRVLLQILDYYVLKELGFNVNSEEFKEKLINRWGNISTELQLIKESNKIR